MLGSGAELPCQDAVICASSASKRAVTPAALPGWVSPRLVRLAAALVRVAAALVRVSPSASPADDVRNAAGESSGNRA
jgi:hypothetical protein